MLGKQLSGDLHNFSGSVHPQVAANGVKFFNKPRSVFWELFFFGENSPLKDIFSSTHIKMNLKLSDSRGPFDNDIFAVETSLRPITKVDYFSFGQLLAYCYYFGIQDLHKDNLLISSDGIQVIDVEQAFSELLLPNQSLLLPANKEINWSAGLNILTNLTLDQLAREEAKAMVDGFVELTNCFLLNLDPIKTIFLNSLNDFKKCPFRVFFRGTREYAEVLTNNLELKTLFKEEDLQLQRGDIPYFFMFLGSDSVYYYSTENWDFKAVNVPHEFIKFINFCAKDPFSIIDRPKIEQQWARGLLFLAKKLVSLKNDDLLWESCSIIRNRAVLNFVSPSLKMSSKI